MTNATTLENWTQTTRPDGTIRLLRRWRLIPWRREEVRLRANYLERRVVFGRWCRVVRITEGWVYVEEVESSGASSYPTYRVRVRGKGGEVVLLSLPAYGSSILLSDHEVPRSVAQLAEFVAEKTEWHLDVPSLLRRGSQIRTV